VHFDNEFVAHDDDDTKPGQSAAPPWVRRVTRAAAALWPGLVGQSRIVGYTSLDMQNKRNIIAAIIISTPEHR
jgi:hypothetical protein